MENRRWRLYRWSNGGVVDTFEGNYKECRKYCKIWSTYVIEWQRI